MKVKLTKEEFELLCSGKFLPSHLSDVVIKAVFQGRHYLLDVSDDAADEIRDFCGEQLQRQGFDENYNPTREGNLLESLIDKFYIG